MARKGFDMTLALVLLIAMCARSLAQLNCPPAIVTLQPCLGFITSNSSASNPSPQCCTQLSSMVQSQVRCLCTFLNLAPPLPFNINRTQAITLPGACKIQAGPLSQCNAAPSGPSVPAAGSPQGAPAPSAPVTPSATNAPSPASPATPSAPSGPAPPSPTTNPGKVDPSTKGGSKGQQSKSSARSSTTLNPSLFFFVGFFAAEFSSF